MSTSASQPKTLRSLSSFLRGSIRNRLTAIVAGAAIIPVLLISLILGWVIYGQVQDALTQDAFEKLAAVHTIKQNQILSYLADRENDMVSLANTAATLRQEAIGKLESVVSLKKSELTRLFEVWEADVLDVASDPGVVAGMGNLAAGFQEVGADYVRSLYLGNSELEIAGDDSTYSAAHFEQHSFFAGYTDIHGYEDAFLIDPAGNVVYSTDKNDFFGTNLVNGPYKDSNLAALYRELLTTPAGHSRLTDAALLFDTYKMFIGSPIYNGDLLVGMLVYQLPLAEIDIIIQNRAGLTSSAESYLVGKDRGGNQLRSNRAVKIGAIGDNISGIAPQKALAGETGNFIEYGSNELSVYEPLDIPGLNWAIVTSSSVIEILSPQVEGQTEDYFSQYKEEYGYYDLFLISSNGYIIYTVAKEPDFQTNILTGPYSDSNLADLVREMNDGRGFESVDFERYAPSGGAPAAFFGMPLVNAEGGIDMFVAAQVSLAQIDEILVEKTGLGESGETYMVGPDKLWRNDSRFLADLGVETTVLDENFKVDTVASNAALAGESGQDVIDDYRGIPVLSVWSPIQIDKPDETHPEGRIWALMAEIDEEEALAPAGRLAIVISSVITLVALLIGALAVFLGTRLALGFVRPILNLTDSATQVAAGNLSLRVATDSVDEIGTLANTFNDMTAQLQNTLEGLEQRVADRTRALATSAEVSRRLTAILDPRQLASDVVNEVRAAFDYYYAQIYMLDEAGENLVIAGGTGDAGATMLARKHSVPVGRGLVGRAADTNASVLIPDVSQEEGWLPNELLPETKAEAAVPIAIGNQVLGVLDVQHTLVDGLSHEDVILLESLAGQVAISLQNARSYEQTQKQAELESLVNVIGQRIQRTTSVEDTLQTAIRELGTAIGATRVRAKIGSASGGAKTEPVAYAQAPVAEVERENGSGSSDPESTPAE